MARGRRGQLGGQVVALPLGCGSKLGRLGGAARPGAGLGPQDQPRAMDWGLLGVRASERARSGGPFTWGGSCRPEGSGTLLGQPGWQGSQPRQRAQPVGSAPGPASIAWLLYLRLRISSLSGRESSGEPPLWRCRKMRPWPVQAPWRLG